MLIFCLLTYSDFLQLLLLLIGQLSAYIISLRNCFPVIQSRQHMYVCLATLLKVYQLWSAKSIDSITDYFNLLCQLSSLKKTMNGATKCTVGIADHYYKLSIQRGRMINFWPFWFTLQNNLFPPADKGNYINCNVRQLAEKLKQLGMKTLTRDYKNTNSILLLSPQQCILLSL